MAWFDHARFLFLTFGALCSGACSGATPAEGEGKRAAESYAASAPVEPRCAPSHEHFTDLGALDPDHAPNLSVAVALNDRDTVVGFGLVPISPVESTVHAFRWKAETGMVDLGVLVGSASSPTGVNEQDEVVGNATMPGGLSQAVVWDAENAVHELGTLGGWSSYGRSINNRGQVVGEAHDAAQIARPFIWDAKTGMVALELPEPYSAVLHDINDSGVVVGTRTGADNGFVPFKWTKEGGPIDLDLLGGTAGEALSINNKGEIAGFVIIDDEHVGVKWTECGAERLPPSPDGVDTTPRAINDQGVMVGDNSIHPSDTPPYTAPYTALQWDPMLRVRILPLQAACSSAPDVNNCSDVAGIRVAGDFTHAYLWEPERPAP
jgi:uncharacterized membrane protein